MRHLRCCFSVAFLLLATACVSIVGGPGGISPTQFHFSPIVSLQGRGPGGWKMARLIITLARVSEGGVHNVPCRVQVEVPETNFLGTVDDMDPSAPHFSTPQLLEVVHRYYPSYVRSSEVGYGSSEQYQRLLKTRQEASSSSARWEELLRRLEEALPDCRVEDWTALFSNDNCWRARLYLPAPPLLADGGKEVRAVVVLVSIIAPVFVLYSSLQHHVGKRASPSRTFYSDIPETQPYVEKIEPLVRSSLQVQRLPTEVLFTSVPDIHCGNVHMGDAQLIDCLFTDDRW